HTLSTTARWWVVIGLLAGFAVKIPLFPVHTWLPLAHTEAPTAGSVILAGVLLKLGTYGLLRLALPIGLIGLDGQPVFPGLARIMPKLAFCFVLFTLSSIGLPGTNGFVSEFLTILGAFTSRHLGIGYGALAAIGIILGAVYMLHMIARVVWGPLKVPATHD